MSNNGTLSTIYRREETFWGPLTCPGIALTRGIIRARNLMKLVPNWWRIQDFPDGEGRGAGSQHPRWRRKPNILAKFPGKLHKNESNLTGVRGVPPWICQCWSVEDPGLFYRLIHLVLERYSFFCCFDTVSCPVLKIHTDLHYGNTISMHTVPIKLDQHVQKKLIWYTHTVFLDLCGF